MSHLGVQGLFQTHGHIGFPEFGPTMHSKKNYESFGHETKKHQLDPMFRSISVGGNSVRVPPGSFEFQASALVASSPLPGCKSMQGNWTSPITLRLMVAYVEGKYRQIGK